MKISWEDYGLIRILRNEGMSLRCISDKLEINRATVTKYAAGGFTPDDIITRRVTPTNKSMLIDDLIQKYLHENAASFNDKHKFNIVALHNEINKVIPVSYMTVNRHVHTILEKEHETFIKLDFEPGKVMQVDWYDTQVRLNNQLLPLHVFDAKLPYSGMFFSMAMPDMTFNSFITGHIEAFNFFGGVTETIIYDNLKTAVYEGAGPNAIKQVKFDHFLKHYGINAEFTNAIKGNEKGSVEENVKVSRDILFTPIKSILSLEQLYDDNLSLIVQYAKNHTMRGKSNTIFENFQLEKKHFLSLPLKNYPTLMSIERTVDKFSLVPVDTSNYSVPDNYLHKKVTIIKYPYTIQIWHNGSLIAEHPRSLVKHAYVYDPHHFIDTLSKKRRAIQHAAPLSQGRLTPEMSEFVNNVKSKERNETIFNLLLLERQFGIEAVSSELIFANINKQKSFNKLFKNIQANYKPINNVKIDYIDNKVVIPQQLNKINVDFDSLNDYDSLISGELDNQKHGETANSHAKEDDEDEQLS